MSAGEHSGERLAAELVLNLNEEKNCRFFGVTGPTMRRAGVRPIANISDFSMMGLWDVARQLGRLRQLEQKIWKFLHESPPDLMILVDFPGLHLRLAEQAKMLGIKVVQYVAPKLWAWGDKRADRIRRDFDLVLGILPFEHEYFSNLEIPFAYVGCPYAENLQALRVSKQALGFSEKPLIACLPGSRPEELQRMLPLMFQLKNLIQSQRPEYNFVLALAPGLDESMLARYGSGFHICRDMTHDVLAVADAAIVTSGTATLECAFLKTPLVVLYEMDDLSYHLAKTKVGLQHISLVNILLQRDCVPEHVQNFPFFKISSQLIGLVEKDSRKPQLAGFEQLSKLFYTPVQNASEVIKQQFF